jgi:hypothetical protein
VYLLRSKSTGSQFAVKRAKGIEADQRKRFLAELQLWIDLPEHANLVPCRFSRTLVDHQPLGRIEIANNRSAHNRQGGIAR